MSMDYIGLIKEKYGDKYDYSLCPTSCGRDECITIICKEHGEFTASPRRMLYAIKGTEPYGCPECAGRTRAVKPITRKQFMAEMKRLYGNSLSFRGCVYKNQNSNITYRCPEHGKLKRKARHLLKGKGCPYCSGEKVYFKDWILHAREVHGDRYEYDNRYRPIRQTDVIGVICKEHGLFEQRYDVHVKQACGCPKCVNYPNKITRNARAADFIRKSNAKFGDRYDYSKVMDMYVNNDTHVLIRCREHDYEFSVSPDTHLRGSSGCPMCSNSEGEVVVRKWLDDHKVKYIVQYHVEHNNPECKRLYLTIDFYLPKHNVFIEYNGEQHYKEVTHFFSGRGWSIEDQQIRDQTLRDICKGRGIRLLEIPYWEFKRIGEILDGENLTAEPAKHRKRH